jgi:hypothetical protein
MKQFITEAKRLQELAGIITEDETDVKSMVKDFYNYDPQGFINGSSLIQQKIVDKIGRSLTSIEKGKITREFEKLWFEDENKRNKEESIKQTQRIKDRAEKNILPSGLDDYFFTPDPKYYKPVLQQDIDRSGYPTGTSHQKSREGYGEYVIKDEYRDKPISGTIKIEKTLNDKLKGEYSVIDFYRILGYKI